jgi:hypothetical protein
VDAAVAQLAAQLQRDTGVAGVVVALREQRPLGQVVAVAAHGDARVLVGRALAPDDHVNLGDLPDPPTLAELFATLSPEP